jgi:hypothetical protein
MRGLTDLQQEILRRFFAARQDFFLTGGAALAGFHLHHRVTHDLDLFSVSASSLEDAERTLAEIAQQLGYALDPLRRSPSFLRLLLKGSEEGLVIDFVRDEAPQLYEKVVFGTIIVDSAEEILANKLCTILSRAEIRDLVDVVTLAKAGFDPIAAVPAASKKDGGMSASQLAWVLSSFPIPLDESLLHGVPRQELVAFRDDLIRRLTALAFPEESRE